MAKIPPVELSPLVTKAMNICPFCGGESRLAKQGALLFVQCQSCLARGPHMTTHVQAVRLWNDED